MIHSQNNNLLLCFNCVATFIYRCVITGVSGPFFFKVEFFNQFLICLHNFSELQIGLRPSVLALRSN